MTTDLGPRLSAKRQKIDAVKVPDDDKWRLHPESDEKDKKIREQAEEIKFLSNNFATARITFKLPKGFETKQIPVEFARYRDFDAQELDALVSLGRKRTLRLISVPIQRSLCPQGKDGFIHLISKSISKSTTRIGGIKSGSF